MPAAKLTPKLRDALCDELRRGHYIHAACAKVGIARSTYKNWNRRGLDARALREEGHTVKRDELPYLAFVDATELARDYGEHWLAEQALDAAARKLPTWSAYVTILERSRPERWRRRSGLEATDGSGNRVEVVLAFLKSEVAKDG